MEDLAGHQFGPYRVVEALGEGGMAAVYKAFQPAVNRYVALKVLSRSYTSDPQFLRRFQHEATILAQFQHPHILPIFDFGESSGYTFLAMPFINGGTLGNILHGRPLSFGATERVIRQLSDALDYAHSKGVVHRDLKPSNVLIDERGNCLLADFGIARITEATTRLTVTGTVIGTPEYMSPEQASGEKVGPASDIYSLGILLYELLTGRVPFKAETPIAVAIKHLTAPLPPPRGFNPALTDALEAVVLKALARSPGERFKQAEDMAAALSASLREVDALHRRETIVATAADVEDRIPTMVEPSSPRASSTPAAVPPTIVDPSLATASAAGAELSVGGRRTLWRRIKHPAVWIGAVVLGLLFAASQWATLSRGAATVQTTPRQGTVSAVRDSGPTEAINATPRSSAANSSRPIGANANIDRPQSTVPKAMYRLRSAPAALTDAQVKAMLAKAGIYDNDVNPTAPLLLHDYVAGGSERQPVVFDRKTGLMWHRTWGNGLYSPADAHKRVETINRTRYAGYEDWRLPTIEELLSVSDHRDSTQWHLPTLPDAFTVGGNTALWASDTGIVTKQVSGGECLYRVGVPPPRVLRVLGCAGSEDVNGVLPVRTATADDWSAFSK